MEDKEEEDVDDADDADSVMELMQGDHATGQTLGGYHAGRPCHWASSGWVS